VKEAIKDKIQVNLTINNHAGGPSLLAQKISQILPSEKKQRGSRSC
jgi:hypothetical protein